MALEADRMTGLVLRRDHRNPNGKSFSGERVAPKTARTALLFPKQVNAATISTTLRLPIIGWARNREHSRGAISNLLPHLVRANNAVLFGVR